MASPRSSCQVTQASDEDRRIVSWRLNFENKQDKIWFQMNIAEEARIYGQAKIGKTKHLIRHRQPAGLQYWGREKLYKCT